MLSDSRQLRSTMATPQVPPRPVRSPKPQQQQLSANVPQVPPRSTGRRTERSQSPSRFAPSPLNDIPFNPPSSGGPYGNHKHSASSSSIDTPARPPSVSLPSIGQEGNEYADIEYQDSQEPFQETILASSPTTSHVGSDLPLHAPKPSLSKADQKARIAGVTRTDSTQAVASGIGKIISPVDKHDRDPYNRPLKSKTSSGFVRSASSLSTERPGSAMEEEEHGIPHIGQHVPMLPNAGDVQAPSPAPGTQHPVGIGFHNDGSRPRHHGRTRSGREVFRGPPGSYGLHGHGMKSTDRFEKAWYEKHPDAAAREEHGQYSPAIGENRPEWALSHEDLNKVVHGSAKGAGFGIICLPWQSIKADLLRYCRQCRRATSRTDRISCFGRICQSHKLTSSPKWQLRQQGSLEQFPDTCRIATTQGKFSSQLIGSTDWQKDETLPRKPIF